VRSLVQRINRLSRFRGLMADYAKELRTDWPADMLHCRSSRRSFQDSRWLAPRGPTSHDCRRYVLIDSPVDLRLKISAAV
jgi:hypothetical protein